MAALERLKSVKVGKGTQISFLLLPKRLLSVPRTHHYRAMGLICLGQSQVLSVVLESLFLPQKHLSLNENSQDHSSLILNVAGFQTVLRGFNKQ